MTRSAPVSVSSARRTPAGVPPSSRTTNSGSTCLIREANPSAATNVGHRLLQTGTGETPLERVSVPRARTTAPTSTRPSCTLTLGVM